MPNPKTMMPDSEAGFDIEKILLIDPEDDGNYDPNRVPVLMGDLVEPPEDGD